MGCYPVIVSNIENNQRKHMLIYVNQFQLVGDNSSQTAFKTVAGWLKNVTKRHFTVAELKGEKSFQLIE